MSSMLHQVLGAILLFMALIAYTADSEVSSVDAEIDLPSKITVVSYPGNDTHVSVQGTFRVTEKNGPDQFLRLTGDLSADGGQWPASVDPSTFEDVMPGTDYDFTIDLIVPAGTETETNTAYTVTLLLTNVLGANQIVDSFRVDVEERGGGGGGDGGVDIGVADLDEFPWGLLIFICGLIVFLVLGLIWSYRNLELVREIGGKRRIMMREKRSGRVLKRRYPPSR